PAAIQMVSPRLAFAIAWAIEAAGPTTRRRCAPADPHMASVSAIPPVMARSARHRIQRPHGRMRCAVGDDLSLGFFEERPRMSGVNHPCLTSRTTAAREIRAKARDRVE